MLLGLLKEYQKSGIISIRKLQKIALHQVKS